MNGYFQLACDNRETYLYVYPPTSGGMAVSNNEIAEYLGSRSIAYDSSAIASLAGATEVKKVLINYTSCSEVRES